VSEAKHDMGYYTRILTKREDCPTLEELQRDLHKQHPQVILSLESGDPSLWDQLILADRDGTPITAVERNAVVDGELGEKEIEEFLDDIEDAEPRNAASWLTDFLRSTRVIYAFQHLSGSNSDAGFEALDTLRSLIWDRGGAIIQADGEGFSNEEGYTILWQFSEDVKGSLWMAVLEGENWITFEMDLGNKRHREAFRQGKVPAGAAIGTPDH
jgi:hypothetical protein